MENKEDAGTDVHHNGPPDRLGANLAEDNFSVNGNDTRPTRLAGLGKEAPKAGTNESVYRKNDYKLTGDRDNAAKAGHAARVPGSPLVLFDLGHEFRARHELRQQNVHSFFPS